MPSVEDITPYSDSRDKGHQVQQMFDTIAPAYDFMNHAMSFGLDRLWLRRLVRAVAADKPNDIIDLATGTGDVALAMAKAMPQACITGLDLSEGMLDKAREKAAARGASITFIQGDCLDTGLPSECADVITIAYGVRNFADIKGGYREMLRLLRPGGKLYVLELSVPTATLTRMGYNIYTRTLIPLGGRLLSGDKRAYTYLPESIAAVPKGTDMTAIMTAAGFTNCIYTPLSLGVCTLYQAQK